MIRRSLAGLVLALVLASSSYGVLISDFEGSLSGWYTDEYTVGTISMSSIGATSGTGSMLVEGPGGWYGLTKVDIKAHREILGISGAQVSVDVTSFAADMTGGWAEVFIVINAQGYDDDGDPSNNIGYNALDLKWMDRSGTPQTIIWDIPEALSAKIAGSNDGIDWFELLIASNTEWPDSAPDSVAKFYVDNVHVTPEPCTIALLGIGGLLLRRASQISDPQTGHQQ